VCSLVDGVIMLCYAELVSQRHPPHGVRILNLNAQPLLEQMSLLS
jgi:hypothetical protein